LGYPNIEEFKQFLTRQMEMDKDRQNRLDVENQIVEALIKDAKLTVPQTLVKRQMEHRIEDLKQRFQHQGVPEAEVAKREDEWRKELQSAVERDVKAYLIFDEIAKQEKITVGEKESLPNKVMAFLMKEAVWEEVE
jgi:FKBP-type peptidyl-prolyl cis-trans isomerase (trigger factor)